MKRFAIFSLLFVFSCALGSVSVACDCGCLTRTPGFWGNHPDITIETIRLGRNNCGYRYLGIEDATEDLCFSGEDFKENDTSPQQLQLIRQCLAAYLNRGATQDLGGDCDCYLDLDGLLDECCQDICGDGLTGQAISETGCIERLDAFNNSVDIIRFEPGDLFLRPGPADPEMCKDARGNGYVNPRDLGPGNDN